MFSKWSWTVHSIKGGSLKFGKNVTVFSLLLYFLIESDFYFASLETFLKNTAYTPKIKSIHFWKALISSRKGKKQDWEDDKANLSLRDGQFFYI